MNPDSQAVPAGEDVHPLRHIFLLFAIGVNRRKHNQLPGQQDAVDGMPQNFGQERQRRRFGNGFSRFPFGHRLGADIQLFGQLLLGHPFFLAEKGNPSPDFFRA
ncbi:hypothetical protein D3C75_1165810 [compost metagenome]